MNRNKDLITASGLALLASILAWLPLESSWLRLVFGLPLALYLPGYALQAAAFPGSAPGRLERFMISLGSSLALTTLGGLLLDRFPGGLSAGAWALLLFAATLVACLVAVHRRRRETAALERWDDEPGWFDLRQITLFGLAALVVLLAIGLSRSPTTSQGLQGYSLLWVLPSGGENTQAVELGVLSQEFSPTRYRLQARSSGTLLADWPDIQLAPGENWTTTLELPPDLPPAAPLQAVLYRSDQPDTVYRTVKLDRSSPP